MKVSNPYITGALEVLRVLRLPPHVICGALLGHILQFLPGCHHLRSDLGVYTRVAHVESCKDHLLLSLSWHVVDTTQVAPQTLVQGSHWLAWRSHYRWRLEKYSCVFIISGNSWRRVDRKIHCLKILRKCEFLSYADIIMLRCWRDAPQFWNWMVALFDA